MEQHISLSTKESATYTNSPLHLSDSSLRSTLLLSCVFHRHQARCTTKEHIIVGSVDIMVELNGLKSNVVAVSYAAPTLESLTAPAPITGGVT